MSDDPAVNALFGRSEPGVRTVYHRLLAALEPVGAIRIEPKKTSIHLAARSAFAGVHPRKSAILLNIRSAVPIDSPRIRKREQVSANRFHNELLLTDPVDVDEELIGWLRSAYALSV